MAELAGKRLLIVEEALRDFVGHWYEYVRAVAELNRAAGVEVTVVGHREASAALRGELGVRPLFEKSPWDGVYRHPVAVVRKLGLDEEKVNVNGGAIALGHPLGMSGARLVVSLLHELRRRNGRYGLATLCVGVGQGVAALFER